MLTVWERVLGEVFKIWTLYVKIGQMNQQLKFIAVLPIGAAGEA
jgi:hypothetical protein